jgi:hypothetical protein
MPESDMMPADSRCPIDSDIGREPTESTSTEGNDEELRDPQDPRNQPRLVIQWQEVEDIGGTKEWKEIGGHITVYKTKQTTMEGQDGETEKEQMDRALTTQWHDEETHGREAEWKNDVITITRYKNIQIWGRELWIPITATREEVYERVSRELEMGNCNWELWSEREWQLCDTMRVVRREMEGKGEEEDIEKQAEEDTEADDESDTKERLAGKTQHEQTQEKKGERRTRVTHEGGREDIEIRMGTTDLQLRNRISGMCGLIPGCFTLRIDGGGDWPEELAEAKTIEVERIPEEAMLVILQKGGHMREEVVERRATEEMVRERVEKAYKIRRGEYVIRYGGRKEFRTQQYTRITVTEGREEARMNDGERGPVQVPISIQYRERVETTMAEEGKGEADIRAWAQRRWTELGGKEIVVTEAQGRKATHAGARYRVEERDNETAAGWWDIEVTHNAKTYRVRVNEGAVEEDIRKRVETERKLRPGKYRWSQEGEGAESKITVESGVYTAEIREGRRSMTIVGQPGTTLEELKEDVRNKWALGQHGWRLEWGEEEFRMRDRMEIRLERDKAPGDEQVEIRMERGKESRRAQVRKEVTQKEVGAIARQEFEIRDDEDIEITRDKGGLYRENERIEVKTKQKRRMKAPKGQTSTHSLNIVWREGPNQKKIRLALPQNRMGKKDMMTMVQQQEKGMEEYEVDAPGHQNY